MGGGEDDQCDHDRTAQCVFPQQEMISVGNTGGDEAYQASQETLLEVLHKMM